MEVLTGKHKGGDLIVERCNYLVRMRFGTWKVKKANRRARDKAKERIECSRRAEHRFTTSCFNKEIRSRMGFSGRRRWLELPTL